MKIEELNEVLLQKIADDAAMQNAYDWAPSTTETPDINAMYSSAFLDGMKYVIDAIVKDNK